MLVIARRFLWIIAFAFWMGGFSFYGGVVITIGAKVLAGGEREFGFVTQQVTNWLNLIGSIALIVFLVDLSIDWKLPGKRGRWLLLCLWFVMALMHAGLIAIHPRMDRLLVIDTLSIRHGADFHALHRVYLGLSTLEWAGSLIFLGGTLWVWNRRDRLHPLTRNHISP